MRASSPAFARRPAAVAALLATVWVLPAALRAWTDPFAQWTADGYTQVLQIDRPSNGRPPYGPVDAYGIAPMAAGYIWDGLQFRDLNVSLQGPLGWDGWSAVAEAQVYLSQASIDDFYVRYDGAWGAFRFGNVFLPFGQEQQTDKADLIGVQRSLLYGFENYGAARPWGLQLLNQRGLGLRWDGARSLGPLTATAAASLQDFAGGQLYQGALGGVGRIGLGWSRGSWMASLGLSGAAARVALEQPYAFAPLGAPQGAAFVSPPVFQGKHAMETWGGDLSLGAGPLHAAGEWDGQELDGFWRGGGEATVWLDLGPWLAAWRAPRGWRRARIYGRWEQVVSGFNDGVLLGGALYRDATVGLDLPTGWSHASVRLEYLCLYSPSFGVLPDGRIAQAEFQVKL